MGRKRSHGNRRPKSKARRSSAPPQLAPVEIPQARRTIEYGEPFTVLEDTDKSTFEFKSGSWVPFPMSIAECRRNDCQVKELPQKVKAMTRYEVRLPLEEDE